jgi:cell wall-associated NlpC family hydrolase
MPSSRYSPTVLRAALACACLAVLTAAAATPASGARGTGGAVFVPPPPPPQKAYISNGRAVAPASVPARIKRVMAAANQIVEKPYRWGGGHRPFRRGQLDSGYDCSGAVSHALYGGGFLRSPLPSGALMSWGRSGPGSWMTVYAHGGHVYLVVAGLRFDTSMRDPDAPGPSTGPRWSRTLRRSASFVPRHAGGY